MKRKREKLSVQLKHGPPTSLLKGSIINCTIVLKMCSSASTPRSNSNINKYIKQKMSH